MIAVVATLAAGCGGDDGLIEPTPGVTLVASPEVVTLTAKSPEGKVYLTTTPSGRLNWEVTGMPDWLRADPMSGRINLNTATLTLTAIDSLLPGLGANVGVLHLISEGGAATVQVRAEAVARPRAEVSDLSLSFTAGADTAGFWLLSTGRGALNWQAQTSDDWLRVSPASGSIYFSSDSVRVTVHVDPGPLPAGTATGRVTITSNSVDGPLVVETSLTVEPIPAVRVAPVHLSYPLPVAADSFYVVNSGKGTLEWLLAPGAPWMTPTPASGSIAPDDSALVTVTVDREAADAAGSLLLSSNAPDGEVVIGVNVGFDAIAPGVPLVLDHRVVDAEIASSGLIVTVSASPSMLHVIDPETGTTQAVALAKPPSSVSVSPDGRHAAVGHDASISYVDLAALAVERVYSVTTDVLDVILGDKGWVYALPRHDQWEYVYSVNLETGALLQDGSIYAGTVGRMHPSGDYLYLADRGISPADFEKVDIRAGPAELMYDSPYHGDYAFGGDLWFMQDGGRIIARSGNVFRSSEARADDMTYAGSLVGISGMRWAVSSTQRSRIYLLANSADGLTTNSLFVYDAGFLAAQGQVTLPDFAAGIPASGEYAFLSPDAEMLYLLVKADPLGGLANDWALLLLETASMP